MASVWDDHKSTEQEATVRGTYRLLGGVTVYQSPTQNSRALIGFVLARELAAFASENTGQRREIIDGLFEENVRGYLKGEKYYDNPGALGLAKTLTSGCGDDLLLLHNGIVIVASSATHETIPKTVRLLNPQIVNGCQSVHTLVENFDHLGEACLPIKIVVTTCDRLRNDIILASNTQAPLTEYDFLSRNKDLRQVAEAFDAPDIALAQKVWLKRRLGQPIAWPAEWCGDKDTSRIITPRNLLEAYVAAVRCTPHIAHDKRGVALHKVTRGEIFNSNHEPSLYRALAWLAVTGRRWAPRNGKWSWHDMFIRAGKGAYPARHHYCFALWRIAEGEPDAVEPHELAASARAQERFQRLILTLSTQDIALGDAAGRAVQAAADSMCKRLDSVLVRSPAFTAAVRKAADSERRRLQIFPPANAKSRAAG